MRLPGPILPWPCHAGSVPLERHQGVDFDTMGTQAVCAAKLRQVDKEGCCDNLRTPPAQELEASLCRAARGDEVIDQEHALAALHTVHMHVQFVSAVFQVVGLSVGVEGQLARFSQRQEAPGKKPRVAVPGTFAIPAPSKGSLIDLMACSNASACPIRVETSRNMMPGFG